MNRSNLPPDKEGINDWGLTYNTDWSRPNARMTKKNRVNFPVFICPKCHNAYELTKDVYKDMLLVHYHEDFPTIGLSKKICIKCK